MMILSDGFEAEAVSNEGTAQPAFAAVPVSVAIGIDQNTRPKFWIRPGCQSRWEAATAFAVEFRGHALAESRVRTCMVVVMTPTIEAALLGQSAPGRWTSGGRFEHAVHLLVRGVVLWTCGAGVLHLYPQLDPPGA